MKTLESGFYKWTQHICKSHPHMASIDRDEVDQMDWQLSLAITHSGENCPPNGVPPSVSPHFKKRSLFSPPSFGHISDARQGPRELIYGNCFLPSRTCPVSSSALGIPQGAIVLPSCVLKFSPTTRLQGRKITQPSRRLHGAEEPYTGVQEANYTCPSSSCFFLISFRYVGIGRLFLSTL
jgi:hypothetical protein